MRLSPRGQLVLVALLIISVEVILFPTSGITFALQELHSWTWWQKLIAVVLGTAGLVAFVFVGRQVAVTFLLLLALWPFSLLVPWSDAPLRSMMHGLVDDSMVPLASFGILAVCVVIVYAAAHFFVHRYERHPV